MNLFRPYLENKADKRFTINGMAGILASIYVVIPCFNEPDLLRSLDSLASCSPPGSEVVVLVVVNSPADAPEAVLAQNILTISQIEKWKKDHASFFEVHTIDARDLPGKYAGVGWARKIGMDAAVRQIDFLNLPDGIIISFDADSTVSQNYFHEIEKAFRDQPKYNFFTINFAHPLGPGLSTQTYEGILRYELHMRYFRNAMKWSGYPHAIHTVGSSFAVRASAYVKQGGMNRKKAGEDFYFLHKIVLLGDYGNINSATVFPSPRLSDRVPFGTGAAMKKWAEGNSELETTYNFEAFIPLKQFYSRSFLFFRMDVNEFNAYLLNIPVVLARFIEESGTFQIILDLQKNCNNEATFTKRFFHHINAFWILKYLNFAHEKYFCRGELYSQAVRLLQEKSIPVSPEISSVKLLACYRDLDKEL